jgi:hypothetical protein
LESPKETQVGQSTRVDVLVACLGIDPASFSLFLEWALSEQLVGVLSNDIQDRSFFDQPDSLKQFRGLLRQRAGRTWSVHDLNRLYEAVKDRSEERYREPVAYGEYLKLLWTVPHRCAQCGREPPEVVLHIDHIIPASLGGESKRHNLQFLCQKCNLEKSDKLAGGEPWLDLK